MAPGVERLLVEQPLIPTRQHQPSETLPELLVRKWLYRQSIDDDVESACACPARLGRFRAAQPHWRCAHLNVYSTGHRGRLWLHRLMHLDYADPRSMQTGFRFAHSSVIPVLVRMAVEFSLSAQRSCG